MIRSQFNVEGMTDLHGESNIVKTVGALTGVNNVEVSLSENIVKIDHNPDLISEKQLRETIEHAGYDVIRVYK